MSRALRRHRNITYTRRAQRLCLRQMHPDGAVVGVCERSVWCFEQRKISRHWHHCPYGHPKYQEGGVRVRVPHFLQAHGSPPPRWVLNPLWAG
jgi:hypothetical protein